MKISLKTEKIITILFLAVFLVFFVLIFYHNTSPISTDYGIDSAFYRFMGSMILKGKVPYVDIWEQKGPVFYAVQALGAIHGTNNEKISFIFVMQAAAVLFSVFILGKINDRISGSGHRYFRFALLVICAFSVLSGIVEGGNYTEDWSVPVICCSLYLFVLYSLKADKDPCHPLLYAFLHGVCFALIAFIRINNAAAICGGLLVIGIYLLVKGQWKNFFANIFAGLLGIAAVTVPVFAWFLKKKALKEMLYAVFVFSFKYTESTKIPHDGNGVLIRFSPVIASLLIILFHLLQTRKVRLIDMIALSVVLVNGAFYLLINRYLHYFIIFVPVFLFVLILYADLSDKPAVLISLAVFAVFIRGEFAIGRYYLQADKVSQFEKAKMYFPKADRESAIAVTVTPEVYLKTGIIPCSRFAAYQQPIFAIDKNFEKEFIETIQAKNPKWIVSYCAFDSEVPFIDDLLKTKYAPQFNDGLYCFFRLTEP